MRPSDKAWIVLGAGVIGWNLTAKDGDLLSEACDRWLLTHPRLTRLAIGLVAVHLANAVSPDYDPIHGAFQLARTIRRRTR